MDLRSVPLRRSVATRSQTTYTAVADDLHPHLEAFGD